MPSTSSLTVLVTGGVGFIGSHLCEALLNVGHRVIVYDNFDPVYPREFKEENLQICQAKKNFLLAEGDIRDEAEVNAVLGRHSPQAVVHLAARAGVRPSLENPAVYADVNVRGTAILLQACQQNGVGCIVFASSSSIYGDTDTVPFREAQTTDRPLSPYGATKKAGEALCHSFSHLYGMSIACLRLFTVYGPRQRPDLAIRKFVTLALRHEDIPVYGDGSSRRDYTHVSDIVGGFLGAIRWTQERTGRFDVFNLGSSHPVVMNDLLKWIEEDVGSPLHRRSFPPQPGDVFQTYANTEKAEQELGFVHAVDFREGLREFVRWMKQLPPGMLLA